MTHKLKISFLTALMAIAVIACKKDQEDIITAPSGNPPSPGKTVTCRTTKISSQMGGVNTSVTSYLYNNQKQLTTARTEFGGKVTESRFSVNAEGQVTRIEEWENSKMFIARVFEYENGKVKTEKQLDETGQLLNTYRFEYKGGKLYKKAMYSVISPGGEEVEDSYTLFETDKHGQITKTMTYVPKMDQLKGEYKLITTVVYEYDTIKATLAYNHFHFHDVEHFYQPYILKTIRMITSAYGAEEISEFDMENSELNGNGYAQKTTTVSQQTGYNQILRYDNACD